MRKKFFKAFICITTVLGIIGAVMFFESYSVDTNIDDGCTIKSGIEGVDEATVIAIKQAEKMMTDIVYEQVAESKTTKIEEPSKSAESKEPVEIHTTTTKPEPDSKALYSASHFMRLGVIYWNGWEWTWYSEKVLPGGGLDIPGRHNDADGYVCDGNGYICLSSSSLSRGTVVDTPFGKQGKVYDTGCASNVIDVYVNW